MVGSWSLLMSFGHCPSFNVKILVTLSDRVGWGSSIDQVMAEDLGEVGVLAEVPRLKLVGADFGVGASQMPWFPVGREEAFDVKGEGDRDGVINRIGNQGRVSAPTACGNVSR